MKKVFIFVCLVTALLALFAFPASAAARQNAMWIMDDLYFTQLPGGDFSHAGTYNFDIIGVNNHNIKAPFDCQVVATFPTYASGNTVIVQSTQQVQFANGTVDYMSLAFAHDNDISDAYVGRTYQQGDVIGQTGSYGNVTGVHSHVTVILGKYTDHPGWVQVSTGNYTFHYAMHPVDALFISDSTIIHNTMGLNFKKASTTGMLNVSMTLDGAASTSCGSFDVYISGQRVATAVTSYSAPVAPNTNYSIAGITPAGEHNFDGRLLGYHGTMSTDDVNIQLPFSSYGALVINGKLNGQAADSIEGYGTFDLYINGNLKAENATQYSGKHSKNTKYSIENITAAENAHFDGEDSAILSGTISSNATTTVTLPFSTRVDPTGEWQECDSLPGNITTENCEIQYYHTYRKTAQSAPGSDWTCSSDPIVSYVKSGGVYESKLPLATSDLVREEGYYYYHFCGPNVSDANFDYTNSYVHYDSVSANDVYVDSTGTDYADARYTFYNLRWNSNGAWANCKGGVTCDGSYGYHGERCHAYYKMHLYQNYVSETNYIWTKESGWVTELDSSADSVRYRFKLKDGEAPVIANVAVSEITPNSYTLDFSATDNMGIAAVEISVWPAFGDADAAQTINIAKESWPANGAFSVKLNIAGFGGMQNSFYDAKITVRDIGGSKTIYTGDDIRVFIPELVHGGTKITLPAKLKEIGADAFAGATAANEIVIPNGTRTIGSRAFAFCSNLSVLYIPDSVQSIADNAFVGSENLVLVCSMNSTAAAHARANGIAYITAE